MRKLSHADRVELDQFLISQDHDTMLFSDLDGFLAGIIVCPELIPPSEWLPVIFGEDGPAFDDQHHADRIFPLILGHYNEIAGALMRKGRYYPIIDSDTDNTFIWETWADGFGVALGMRHPDVWEAYTQSDDLEVGLSIDLLIALVLATQELRPLEPELEKELQEHAHGFIATSLETLNAARMKTVNATAANSQANIGRNDPCPCGSGKKFKHCCLH